MKSDRTTSQSWLSAVILPCLPSYYFGLCLLLDELYSGVYPRPIIVRVVLQPRLSAAPLSFLTLPFAIGILWFGRRHFSWRARLLSWVLVLAGGLCTVCLALIFAMWRG